MAMTEQEQAIFIGVTNVAGAASMIVKAMMQVLNDNVPNFKIRMNHALDEITTIEPYGQAVIDRAREWVADLDNVV